MRKRPRGRARNPDDRNVAGSKVLNDSIGIGWQHWHPRGRARPSRMIHGASGSRSALVGRPLREIQDSGKGCLGSSIGTVSGGTRAVSCARMPTRCPAARRSRTERRSQASRAVSRTRFRASALLASTQVQRPRERAWNRLTVYCASTFTPVASAGWPRCRPCIPAYLASWIRAISQTRFPARAPPASTPPCATPTWARAKPSRRLHRATGFALVVTRAD